jgi:hypothetical protein
MRRVVVVFAVLFVCRSTFGQAPVGSPTALLDGTRFGASVEYGQADTDITFDVDGDALAEDFDFLTVYAAFSVAATERLDFFLRLGASQAETTGFDGDTNFSWGMGTRFTLLKWHDFSWGALAQFTNLVSRHDTIDEFILEEGPVLLDTEEELNLVEYVFATGPTWRHGPLALYGGLLLRTVTGELEADAGIIQEQFDVDEEWDAGGYVGGCVTLFRSETPETYGISRGILTAEGRFTGDSTGFSIGLLLPFGGPL